MTLFLLLFSTSLLIVVQNSIYISKERSVLNRDFFSGLSRSAFALASMGIHAFFAVLETIVFILSYSVFSKFFDKEFPDAGHIFGSYRWESWDYSAPGFLGVAFIALFISALVGKSEITSVILAVVVGIMQFSLSGTILSLPKAIDWVQNLSILVMATSFLGFLVTCQTCHRAWLSTEYQSLRASWRPFKGLQANSGDNVALCFIASFMPYSFSSHFRRRRNKCNNMMNG